MFKSEGCGMRSGRRAMGRKLLSVAMSAVLAIGLCPGLAFAGDGESAPDSSAGSNLVAGLSQDIVAQETGAIDAMNAQALEALTGDGSEIVQVELGDEHSAALVSNGSLWTWGRNSGGQLGNGTTEDSLLPIRVMEDVVQVSLGADRSAALKSDGTLWMWGDELLRATGKWGVGIKEWRKCACENNG